MLAKVIEFALTAICYAGIAVAIGGVLLFVALAVAMEDKAREKEREAQAGEAA